MKLRKIAASIVAAAVAFSTVAFSASAEEAKDEKLTLLTSELTADLKTNMVFVEGVGVVDITGADFDSSENGAADENANLDVDFDGIGYLSKENLKNWKETGVLTLEKLKADFDTTGLKWGMFNAEEGYVQLVKMEKQMVENNWGEEEEQDVVTYRGLYKVENGEIKYLCDLDTSWTYSRVDGISIGFKTETKEVTVTEEDKEPYKETVNTEVKLVVTQPDGKKTETVIAKSDNIPDEIKIPVVTDEYGYDYRDYSQIEGLFEVYISSWSVPSKGDIYADVAVGKGLFQYDIEFALGGWKYDIVQVDKDGKCKTIYEESSIDEDGKLNTSANFDGILWGSGSEGTVVWFDDVPPKVPSITLHGYNANTGKVESYGNETFDWDDTTDRWFYNGEDDYTTWSLDIKYYSEKCTIATIDVSNDSGVLADGYIVLDNLSDFKNWKSKKCYKDIDVNIVGDSIILKYVTKDDKTGFMDADGKVLAEFDAADNFAGKCAPVVKDGKAYLVDKNMNAVSTEIEADDVVAVSEDLFFAKKGDKTYFVTYGGEVKDPATETVVVDYSDNSSDSGITASANKGVIADGAALSVKAVEDKTDATKVTYEISFKKADGTTVQPNGKVTVKIPVPAAFKDKTIYVYRVEADGKYTNMNATVEGNVIVFETEHFSEYVVSTDGTLADTTDSSDSENSNSGGNKTPNTGFGGIAMTFGVFAIAGAAVLVSRKKTR